MDLKYILNDDEGLPPCNSQNLDKQKAAPPLISDEQRFWTSVAEPPDIDYRWIIEDHMENKKVYLEDHEMPFKTQCAWIDFYDTIHLEDDLIREYGYWIDDKLKTAGEAENEKEKEFWKELQREVHADHGSIAVERWRLRKGLKKGPTSGQFIRERQEKTVGDQLEKEREEEREAETCDCPESREKRGARSSEGGGETAAQNLAEFDEGQERNGESESESYVTAEEAHSNSSN